MKKVYILILPFDRMGVYVKNNSGYEYIFSVNDMKKYFIDTQSYFYVSDAGIVKETYIGMNEKADAYRMKIGNKFNDVKSANNAIL